MVDSIKITALQDIGANIAYTTLVPVVNMAGTPTSQKSNLQNLGNLILNGAGGSYFPRAAQANIALSVANAAQPNITSVGTLTSLAVTGNITAGNVNGGNIIVANYFYGDGGFLTNVAGGGSNYSNSNVANYLPTYTGNVSANWIIADYISGNATPLHHIPGANVTGQVPYAAVANSVARANVSGLGNIAVINLDGNSSNVLRGNGAWGPDANSSYGNTNVANYLPNYAGTVGANAIQSTGNLTVGASGAYFIFGEGGALFWPAGSGIKAIETNIDNEFEIRSTNNVVISTDVANANLHFTFGNDGVVYCPANANFEGTRLNVGPGAGNISLPTNPTLVVTDTGLEFVQTALFNQSPNGSSDYAAYGADGDETQGFADLGFAGHNFNDPNYTITNPGDGYVLAQGYANGIGGALVLATGQYGNVPDIVFATGGYLSSNEFARIDHANNVFHLTRANSGIQFEDGSIQTTAYTGTGAASELVNGDESFVLDADGNVVFTGLVAGQGVNRGMVWDFGANANGVNSEVRQDNDGLTVRAWTENGGGANGYSAPARIVTNQGITEKQWIFDGQGNLTMPGNLIMATGNIQSATISPAFNSTITDITTGNATVIVTLADNLFSGPYSGTVTITNVTGTTEANGTWGYQAVEANLFQLYTDATLTTPVDGTSWTPYVSGGDAVGVSDYTSLNIQGGNVSISSNDYDWVFDTNGNLILAGGNSVIQSIANSSLDPLNPNVSTLTLTPDQNYSSQALVLDPTAPGHIHLRSVAYGNADQPSANIFLGGEESSFEVGYYTGSAPNVFVHSGGNTWTFDNTGNLTVPGTIAGPDSSSLVLQSALGSPAGQFATSNGPTYGYGGNLAIFVAGDFTSGSVASVQVGSVVVDNNGGIANVTNVNPGIAGPGTYGIYLDVAFWGATPYTYYSGYGPGQNVEIQSGSENWTFNNAVACPVSVYANLPAATTAGQRAFISDANLVATGNFGNAVSGGGSNITPVWSDGTNWRIG